MLDGAPIIGTCQAQIRNTNVSAAFGNSSGPLLGYHGKIKPENESRPRHRDVEDLLSRPQPLMLKPEIPGVV